MTGSAVERLRLLVTVKAYPAVSRKYGESVCVAGVTEPGPEQRWVRLFPVQFRELPQIRQFRKYQLIDLEVRSPGSDPRPESRKPNLDSLSSGRELGAGDSWPERRPFIEPLMRSSMCEIAQRQSQTGESLGVFRPREILDFEWEEEDGEWDERRGAVVSQPSLMFPRGETLERIPYKFWYRYRCDEERCNGHRQSIIDWELAQAFRSWRSRHRDASDLLDALRRKWIDEMWAPDRDSALFVGNQHQHLASFLVLGVYWPRRVVEDRLL